MQNEEQYHIEMIPTPGPPYEWDDGKRHETLRLRGIDFALAYEINWNIAKHQRSDRLDEPRYSSLVPIEGRIHNVVWTPRGRFTRIISLRKANDREISRYERQQA